MRKRRIFNAVLLSGLMSIALASCGGQAFPSQIIPSTILPSETPGGDVPGSSVQPTMDQRRYIYELAVSSGAYTGTYEEWLESIKGDQIELKAIDNKLVWKFSKEAEWKELIDLNTLNKPGESAYEIYKKYYSYSGTEEQWINDLINGTLRNKESFKVTLVYNLPGMAAKVIEAKRNENISLPKLTFQGYSFVGWVNMYGELVGDSYKASEDMVLVANWMKNEEVTTKPSVDPSANPSVLPTPVPTPTIIPRPTPTIIPEPTPTIIPSNQMTIKLSGAMGEKALYSELFDNWTNKRKNEGDKTEYIMDYIPIGADQIDSKVLDFSDDNAPDIFEFASDKMSNLHRLGAIMKLDNKASEYLNNNFTLAGRDLAHYYDGYYGYTLTADNTYYFHYDKRIFSDTDVKSIEGILAKAKEAEKKVGYGLDNAFYSLGALFTFGSDFSIGYADDGNINSINATFDNENGIRAIKGMKMIMDHPAFNPQCYVGDINFAGAIDGTWNIANYKDELGSNYGVAKMPTITIDGVTKNLGAFMGGRVLGINPSKNPDRKKLEVLNDLAMFFTNKESGILRFAEANDVPANKNALEDARLKNDPNVNVIIEQSSFAHAQTYVPMNAWVAPNTLYDYLRELYKPTEDDYIRLAKQLNDTIKATEI